MKDYGTTCTEHPHALIRHDYDLTQTVLNGVPSGEGYKSNHVYSCAECGKSLSSLGEASAIQATETRIASDFEKAARNALNGWKKEEETAPTIESLVKEFEFTAKARRVLYGNGDCIASVWESAAKRLSQVINT